LHYAKVFIDVFASVFTVLHALQTWSSDENSVRLPLCVHAL